MAWLSSNWIWILLLGFVAFHFFGHRHGHRHGYAHDGQSDADRQAQPPPAGHQDGAPNSGVPTQAPGNPTPESEQHSHRRHGC